MNDREKYFKLFGRLSSLAERVPWSTAVSNLVEWLAWNTKYILGVSKQEYWKRAVKWSHDDAVRNVTLQQKLDYVARKLDEQAKGSEQSERYAGPTSTIASSREAVRRTKFFSEAYLNEEFDICWTLLSDKYLDEFYGRFTKIKGGGQWATHGDSGLFQASTGIRNMEIDNLSYNETEALLVANEFKLAAKKNEDQILKYAWMFKKLRDERFITAESRFLLLFVVVTKEDIDWEAEIQRELASCENSSKRTARAACEPDVIAIAKSAEIKRMTWGDLVKFNEKYSAELDPETQQVEIKLLWGFNESLKVKALMQRASAISSPF